MLVFAYLEVWLLDAKGDLAEALEKICALLPVNERAQGAEHPNTLRAFWLKASIQIHLGDYEKALQELERVLPMQIRVLGETHPHVQDTRDTIENLRKEAG